MGKNGLTKKEINRFKKSELIKMISEKGLPCNKKMSKRDLVDCVFKHKEMRKSLTAPEKRKMSEKQMANLNKFKLGGKHQVDFKNEKVVKQKAQYLADLSKLEDKHAPEQKSESHLSEIKKDLVVKKKELMVREKELDDSVVKVSDEFEQKLKGLQTQHTKENLRLSENAARHTADVRFGEGAPAPDFDLSLFKDASGNLDIDKINRIKADLERNDPTNPLLQVIKILEQIHLRGQARRNQQPQRPQPQQPQRPQQAIEDGRGGGRAENDLQQAIREQGIQTTVDIINALSVDEAIELLGFLDDGGDVPPEVASTEREVVELMRLLRIRIRRGDGPVQIRAPRRRPLPAPTPVIDRSGESNNNQDNRTQEALRIRSQI